MPRPHRRCAPHRPGRDHQARPARQRQEQFQQGDVERGRGHGDKAVTRAQAEIALAHGEHVPQRAARDVDARGSGRPGSEHGVRQGIGRHDNGIEWLGDVPFRRDHREIASKRAGQRRVVSVGHHQSQAGVACHDLKSLQRKTGLKRNDRTTRPPHPQQRGQHPDTAAGAHADPGVGADNLVLFRDESLPDREHGIEITLQRRYLEQKP